MEGKMEIICAGKWGINPVYAHPLDSSMTAKRLQIYYTTLVNNFVKWYEKQ